MNKPSYLRLSILKLRKTVMSEFWYDYVKSKYGEKIKTVSYGYRQFYYIYIKTDGIYKDIVDLETRFDTSDYALKRAVPKGKNKKVIGVMKDELGGKIMKEFLRLISKNYNYLMNDCSEDKKGKKHYKCVT